MLLLFWVFTLSLAMPRLRRIQVQDEEILWLLILQTTCITGFLLRSLQERVGCMAVILYEYF